MVSCLHPEELQYTLSSSHTKFKKICGPFFNNIRRERKQGGNRLCFIYLFIYLFFLYVCLFPMWLWHIVLVLFSIYTSDFFLTVDLPRSPLNSPSFLFWNDWPLYEWTLWGILLNELPCSFTFSFLCTERASCFCVFVFIFDWFSLFSFVFVVVVFVSQQFSL